MCVRVVENGPLVAQHPRGPNGLIPLEMTLCRDDYGWVLLNKVPRIKTTTGGPHTSGT